MGRARKLCGVLVCGLVMVAGCQGPGTHGERERAPPLPVFDLPCVALAAPADTPRLPTVPAPRPDDRPLPINLASALQLASVRAVDVAVAAERVQVAAAVLEHARTLWLPSVTLGGDYYYHAGPIQDVSNAVFKDRHGSVMLGAGTGIGPAAVLTVADAIFAPLVAKQQERARQADMQTASNDTLVAVSDAYFNVQQARGELASAAETTRRTRDLIARIRKLAPEIVPELELFRAETDLAVREKAELLARERWKVASAELVRLVRMDPAAQVEPVEPPHLRIELIDVKKSVDELIPIGLTNRPELASQRAQVEAALERLKQEQWRPLLPNVLLRGASTNPAGTLAGGAYFPAPSGTGPGARGDIDLQVLWQLDNMGFGNRALIHQRQAENRVANVELSRILDRVAADVAQTHAQAQEAARRVEVAERGLRSALLSAEKNLDALSQTKGIGNQVVTLVRPQEVVAAIGALAQAYADYYGAIADSNRAQFRLYRALGQPAQHVIREEEPAR